MPTLGQAGKKTNKLAQIDSLRSKGRNDVTTQNLRKKKSIHHSKDQKRIRLFNDSVFLEPSAAKQAGGLSEEIRALKQQMEFVLGVTKTGIDIIDSEFNLRYIDPEWAKVYGDPTGKKCFQYFMGQSEVCPHCGIPIALKTKSAIVTEEILVKEGNRSIQVTTIPFQNEKGEWLVAEVNVDISERKHIEQALRKTLETQEMRVQERTAQLVHANEAMERDITKRKEAEDALRNEKQRFQTLSDQAPFGMMLIDKEGNFKYVNPKFRKLFGYDLADVPNGRTWFRKAYPDPTYRHRVISDWLNDLANAYPLEKRSRVFRVTCKDGSEKFVNFIPVQLGEGENLVTCEDFTDQIQAEEALFKSEEESKKLAEENAIMAEIGRIISSTLKIEEVYERFAEEVRKLISFDRITIRTIDPKDNTVTIAYISGIAVRNHQIGYTSPLSHSVAEECARIQSGLLLQPESFDEVKTRFPNLLPSFQAGLQSMMFIPLISKDQVIGILSIQATKPKAYTQRDLRLAERVGNQIAGAVTNALLFTQLKQAEEAMRESEEKFRDLYDHAPVGYHEYDKEGRITKVNRTDLEMLGYTAEELIGQPIWKLNVGEEIVREQVLAKLAGASPPGQNLERTYRRKDGTTFPVLIQDRLTLDEKGQIAGIRCTIQDITEHKRSEEALRESEERYRTILENIEDGYYEVDLPGNFTFFNDSLCRMLGYSRDELIGMGNDRYTDQENRKKLFQAFNSVYRTGEPVQGFDWEVIRKDGRKVYGEVSVSLIRNSTGEPVGFRGIARDITERKRAEKEMAALQEQLTQSQKMEAVGRLAGGVAHDFNNLLTVIKGYAQLSLLDLKENNPLRENIQEIQKATERATNLTRQLLAFSRRQILDPKVLDLNSLLRDTEKMLRRMIGEDIELVTRLSEGLGRVKIDPGQFEQVILNLAVNARDAMPSGGKFTIETANAQPDEGYALTHLGLTPGHYVKLSVSDTGVGMSREVQEKAFDPFFTTKEKGKGTGLGLSTVHGIVTQSGGKIWVYSEPGRGTTFKIYFPTIEGQLDTLNVKKEVDSFPRGSETVLLVEDESSVRDLANRLLRQQGYRVLEAAQGEEALHLAQDTAGERIHLLLTDVVLPQMSGKELADQLKTSRPDLKVLYMSGYTDFAVVHQGVLNLDTHFLQKPFSLETLSQKVREALDK
jgi:PAS domain S-box-containing protein